VNRLKLTSPGALLIAAVILAGGILLLDVFCLKPYVAKQKNAALREQAIKVEQAVRLSIRDRQQGLGSACAAWAKRDDAGVFLGSQTPPQAFGDFARKALVPAGAELAWVCDRTGAIVRYWRQADEDPSGPGARIEARQIAEAIKDLGPQAAETGLMRVADKVVLFARSAVGEDRQQPAGWLWVGRFLGAQLLDDIGEAMEAGVVFVAAESLPADLAGEGSTSNVFWHAGQDRLAIAWLTPDAAGRTLGYLRAEIPVVHISRQADITRRIVLIILSLSVGLVLLVIMGTHILIAGPVVRLVGRLQKMELGQIDVENLTSDLHGEPLVLARRLESAFDRLARISKTDELTGLANRRQFEEVLGLFYHQARRYNRPLSLIVMDIDFFKAVNDAGGHQAGDELLKIVAEKIERACRKADLPARIGGDEFAVLLPETSAPAAEGVAERIRQSVSEEQVITRSLRISTTLSIGVADLNAGAIDSVEAMTSLADKALYVAKERGRNCLVQAHDLNGPVEDNSRREESGKVDLLHKKLAGLDNRFKGLFVRAVEEIMDILEHRDPYMADHARKVQHYALLIAREMELPERVQKRIQIAAMLHDIGMVAMPDSVLLNPGGLDEAQLRMMQRHTLLSVRVMEGMEFLEQEIPAVRYHHERFDGKGYPEGLCGPAIPLTARILAVADAFDAMTSPRTFRQAKSCADAMVELQRGAGTQFDPVAVEAFIAVALRLGDKLTEYPRKEIDLIEVADAPEAEPCETEPAEAGLGS